jgi:hypothetical protein
MAVCGIKYAMDAARPVGLASATTPERQFGAAAVEYDTVLDPAVMATLWLYANE